MPATAYISDMTAGENSRCLPRATQSARTSTVLARLVSRLALGLHFGAVVGALFCFSLRAEEDGKFLFLTLRSKDGVITVMKSAVVSDTLKPQRDSAKPDALRITLEKTEGESAWSVAIDDPSVRRYEYEDPEQPGVIRVKEIKLKETEFIVRAPLVAGVRHLAVYRREPPAPGAKPSAAPTNKMLVRYALPQEVTR